MVGVAVLELSKTSVVWEEPKGSAQEETCAACGHERRRHLQGKFDCCYTYGTRVANVQGTDRTASVLQGCLCKEFKEL